jgi:riboflavin kinase/FMN adenylyltransferase
MGVANVGWRPTVAAGLTLLLEVHLLDVTCDLYDVRVRVYFRQRLRDEQKFACFADLQAQIAQDVQQARVLLG